MSYSKNYEDQPCYNYFVCGLYWVKPKRNDINGRHHIALCLQSPNPMMLMNAAIDWGRPLKTSHLHGLLNPIISLGSLGVRCKESKTNTSNNHLQERINPHESCLMGKPLIYYPSWGVIIKWLKKWKVKMLCGIMIIYIYIYIINFQTITFILHNKIYLQHVPN